MKTYLKCYWYGTKAALNMYKYLIEENKWMIILFIIDMIFIPVKMLIFIPLSFTKWFSTTKIYKFGEEVIEEFGD